MQPQKISQLPINSSPSLTDYLPELNTSLGVTQRATLSSLASLFASQFLPSGMITEYGGRVAPTGWVLCYGQAISRTSNTNLFNALVPFVGNPTITIASPAVVTLSGHNFVTGDQVYLTTTGALPTGLSVNTLYYVINVTSSTFKLATSLANAYAGTAINTSGTQSGTHSIYSCPYGNGDGTTTFNTPDLRGRVPAGADAMGGTAANRLTGATNSIHGNVGVAGGNETNSFDHNHLVGSSISTAATQAGAAVVSTTNNTGNASGGSNPLSTQAVVQPTLITNFIIKT